MRPSPSRRRSGSWPRPGRAPPRLRTVSARSSRRSTSSPPPRVPESLVRSAIGEMVGRPRSRHAVRESLERPALGLFADILVEEIDAPEGIRLRYHLTPRPLVRRIAWQGDAGSTSAACRGGIPCDRRGGPRNGSPAGRTSSRSTAARAISTLGSRSRPCPSPERRGRTSPSSCPPIPARLAQVRLEGSLGLPEKTATEALGLRTGDRYRRPRARTGARPRGAAAARGILRGSRPRRARPAGSRTPRASISSWTSMPAGDTR